MKTSECPNSLSLDEAIAHADEVAGDCSTACRREHKQLADWLRELKSRRSAERGDAAKLREAAEFVAHIDDNGYTSHDVQCAIDKARAAFSAPPRNCDRFQTTKQAKEAYFAEVRHVSVWDGCETERLVDWLLCTATEQEGGSNADK